MILYFTGTGNSRYAADVISRTIGDTTVSLNDVMKNKLPLSFESEKPFVIVAPIYAWRLPLRIEELIRNAQFNGNKDVYFVVTMGQNSGNCDKYCEKLCKEKGLNFKGLWGVTMPSNYIVTDTMPTAAQAQKKLDEVTPSIRETAKKIKNGESIKKTDVTKAAGLMSGAINSLFNKFAVTSKDYVCSDKCTACGTCVRVCPTDNIKLSDKKPVFGNSCMSCYACLNHCPKAAIDIKGKSENKGRYICPEYTGE